jgi:hypothetical protein
LPRPPPPPQTLHRKFRKLKFKYCAGSFYSSYFYFASSKLFIRITYALHYCSLNLRIKHDTWIPYFVKTRYLSVCLSVCLPACLPVCLPACLPACLSTCLSACLRAIVSLSLSVCLSVCHCLSIFVRLKIFKYNCNFLPDRPSFFYIVKDLARCIKIFVNIERSSKCEVNRFFCFHCTSGAPFRITKFSAYKRNKAKLDPFHMCFTISL